MKLNIISVVLFLLIFVWSNVYPFLLNFVLQNVEIGSRSIFWTQKS